jgi:sigma-B regulation protein RsbU (phosphoserine phosphatase)
MTAPAHVPAWRTRTAWLLAADDDTPTLELGSGQRTSTAGPSALLKQGPMVVLYAVALLLGLVVPSLAVVDPGALLVSAVLLAVATLLAALVTLRPDLARLTNLVPALDFAVVAVLRLATGENASIYGSLLVLPVVWLGANRGRWHILTVFVGVYLTLALPGLLALRGQNENELWRGLYSALAFTFAAFVVNELSRLARRSLDAARERERVAAEEMARASMVQQALLPKSAEPLHGYQVAGACLPSKAVGGDFFDWYPVKEGLAFTLGDVMGKGVGAGIIAATARAVVRSAKNVPDPVAAIERTADCFTAELGETASFATVFHARVRAEDDTVLFADAGHGLSALVRADGSFERLASDDLPVGVPGAAGWTSHEVRLGPGDLIVTFSDGVLDLYDGTLRAVDHVVQLARLSGSAEELVGRITALAEQQPNPDDVTVLVLRREV